MTENKKTILLVEDEVIIAMMEARILEKNGYSVITAHSGEEAVEFAGRNPDIDLVLMDIDLGRGMDGTEAARIILNDHDLPVVFLSSHTEPEIVEKTEGITSYGYVVKNSGETILLASIRMAFKLHHAHIHIDVQKQDLQAANEELRSTLEELEAANEEFEVVNEELIRSEEELRVSEERYRTIFEHSPIGMFWFDRNSVITECNDEFVRIIGSSREALTGLNMLERLKDEALLSAVREALAGRPGHYEGVYHSVTANKATPVRGLFTGITEIRKGVTGCVGIFEDITYRKHAEETLRVREEHFRTWFEDDLTGDYRVDAEGTIIECNRAFAEMFGYDSPSELTGRNISLVYPDDEERKTLWDRLGSVGRITNYESKRTRKDGIIIAVIENIIAVLTEDGKIASIKGYMFEITNRKKAEDDLALAVEEKQALLNELQHRVKNSLTMMASLAALEEERSNLPETRAAMGTLRGRILSLANLYAMLFATGETREVRLDRYLNEIARSLLKANPGGGVIDFCAQLENITVDARRASPLGLIANELITNALKYAFWEKTNGRLCLSLRRAEGVLELKVTDNGAGLPEGFDMDRSTGLGMLLITLLSRQLGGIMEYRREGDESVFCVTAMENQ
jgi:PAS domain S-box-containing protein